MDRENMVCGVVGVFVGEVIGDTLVAHVNDELAARCWCPEELEHLLEPPADRDDAVATLRWTIAHSLDIRDLEEVARASGVSADRITAFMYAPAGEAGELLTLAEAARLARLHELRFEDRELADELDDSQAIAEPYLEAAGLDYAEAVRRAEEIRDAFRESDPEAVRIVGSGGLGAGG